MAARSRADPTQMILTAKRMEVEQTARAAEAAESKQSDDDGGVDEATAEGAAKLEAGSGKPHGASLGRSATEHSATHDSRNARAGWAYALGVGVIGRSHRPTLRGVDPDLMDATRARSATGRAPPTV